MTKPIGRAMSGFLIRKAFHKTLSQVCHVRVVPPTQARDLVASVYAQAERDHGVLSPLVAVHSAAPEVLAACWVMLRETLIADGHLDRVTKEAVATAVSIQNACQYCVEAHLSTLDSLNEHRDAAAPDDVATAAADHTIRAITEWARAGGTWRTAPVPAEQLPELVATVLTVQYLNRMATLFLPRSAVPAGIPDAGRAATLRLYGRFLVGAAARPHTPGVALRLLPAAPVPADLGWAKGSPNVTGALARAFAAVDAAGARSVPKPVRALLDRELGRWNGSGPDPDPDEIDLSTVEERDRPAARLALRTALAPHEVDRGTVEEFRRGRRGDRALLELTAWASLAAARRIAGRLAAEPPRGADVLPFRRRPR
ncbi:MAG TPA: carboxymuconolactone decarboxylase family protein [Actinophytocola sp.]|uniref:carboxymuconolactone decarboxylase family protein n=1 Tax=Actinophytocola sp. TaxID=1872138 RepID=UPI002DB6EFA3|nr:carboxymuconolactone decarboxylase family protein [Actinophytocola sp.]HEU5474178.1 carboxymuconolactone decarboxylase family protein [Actinophytocola sp.]